MCVLGVDLFYILKVVGRKDSPYISHNSFVYFSVGVDLGFGEAFDTKMQACGSSPLSGSLQQPGWAKASPFPSKGFNPMVCPSQLKLNTVKPMRSAYIEGSMVAGRPVASSSVAVEKGKYLWHLNKHIMLFL